MRLISPYRPTNPITPEWLTLKFRGGWLGEGEGGWEGEGERVEGEWG